MKTLLLTFVFVIVLGLWVGSQASADQPPNTSAWCGPAAVAQAQANGLQVPPGAAVCWYPATSR